MILKRLVFALVLVSTFAFLASCRPIAPVSPDECPIPDGVTEPEPLPVTAKQVEDGTGSLKEFTLAFKDELATLNDTPLVERALVTCLIRKEGSQYRYGSTYMLSIVDGRVWVNAKRMSIGGRLLKSEIHLAILQAVGINPAVLVDPMMTMAAFTEAAEGDGGAFDVPGIPNASGYAVASLDDGLPYILIAGFDLEDAHLDFDEVIEYGDPEVTAADVVDRETLKAFVTAAGNLFVSLYEAGDITSMAHARIAGRDPNGPWLHGSVYLYGLDTVNDVIFFHGAFPDRYEMRPLVPVATDIVTGKLVLPQVLEAARSSPEGGFVDYYFDDPNDASDRPDIPKTGYARVFKGVAQRGPLQIPYEIIVGSGFYHSE